MQPALQGKISPAWINIIRFFNSLLSLCRFIKHHVSMSFIFLHLSLTHRHTHTHTHTHTVGHESISHMSCLPFSTSLLISLLCLVLIGHLLSLLSTNQQGNGEHY